MTTRIIVSLALAAALVSRAGAQSPLALTSESLKQAVADGSSQPAGGLPLLAARIERRLSTAAPITVGQMTAEYDRSPYEIYLLTPFVRAASTAADAKRRSVPVPAMTPDGINADGIVISVIPGPGAAARSIDSVTLKHGDDVIRPVKSALQPPSGGGRASGAFYFRLEDFSAMPLTLVCVGGASSISIILDAEDLAAAHTAVNVAVTPSAYLAKLRGINDTNTKLAEEQADRDTAQRTADDASVFVKSSDYTVVETNGAFTKYRWRATVVNGSLRRQVFDVTARFVDGSGAAIETQQMYAQLINSQSERVITGEAQIAAAKASSVSKVSVVATRKAR